MTVLKLVRWEEDSLIRTSGMEIIRQKKCKEMQEIKCHNGHQIHMQFHNNASGRRYIYAYTHKEKTRYMKREEGNTQVLI